MGLPSSPARIRRRRGVALLAAVAATFGIWVAFVRGGDDQRGGGAGGSSAGISDPVQGVAGRMTPEQAVDQVLLLGFDGTDATSPIVTELGSRQIGGVLVQPSNWLDAGQGAQLVATLRGAGLAGGRIPPLVVAQQEGGDFRSFPDLPPAVGQTDIGARASPKLAERWSLQAGQALRAVGFDLNLAPVADIASQVSPVASRAFSDDPVVVAGLTAAAVRGCRRAGIACAISHFPGLGAASQDTDEGPATVGLDASTLSKRDLAPFRSAITEGAPAVVMSLAYYAAVDPVTPAALSPDVATGILRDRLGFTGLAITDDLGAGAVTATYSVQQAAVTALAAGSDMVRIDSPADQAGVREAILRAVETGELPEARLRQAAARVLQLKRVVGLLRGNL
jgi:beta-N-acetylhexosaminidase